MNKHKIIYILLLGVWGVCLRRGNKQTSSKNCCVRRRMCLSSVSSRKFFFRASWLVLISFSSFSSFSKVACQAQAKENHSSRSHWVHHVKSAFTFSNLMSHFKAGTVFPMCGSCQHAVISCKNWQHSVNITISAQFVFSVNIEWKRLIGFSNKLLKTNPLVYCYGLIRGVFNTHKPSKLVLTEIRII